MNLVSQSEFAILCKISRQAVHQKVQCGIVLLNCGKIDLDEYSPKYFSHKRNTINTIRFDKFIEQLEQKEK